MNGDNALTVTVRPGHLTKTYVKVAHKFGGGVTLCLEAGSLRPDVTITQTVTAKDMILGQFEKTIASDGSTHLTLVTPTGRTSVKVTVHESNVPFGTKLMLRGYPKGDNENENKEDRYFVIDTYEGEYKVCTGGVNMEQWGVHGVKANKDHKNYVVQGLHAGTFQMDFHLGHIFEDVEPAPVMRGGTTRGGGGPTRSYAAQYHNAGNSGHKTTAVKIERDGPTTSCSWRTRVADKVKLDECPVEFCSSVPAPIQADPESEEDDLD